MVTTLTKRGFLTYTRKSKHVKEEKKKLMRRHNQIDLIETKPQDHKTYPVTV